MVRTLPLFALVLAAGFLRLCLQITDVAATQFLGKQARADTDTAGGIRHPDGRTGIVGLDFHRGMHPRGCRPADQKRHGETLALHLPGDVSHFLERRCDQTRQSDDVGIFLARGLQNFLRGHHYTEIHHVEIVALEHHRDDVLADVVDIALHRGDHDLALALAAGAGTQLLRFDIRNQVRHRLLHHARRFHHLGQKHLAGAEQIADHIHALHQRALDHLDRVGELQARLLGILDDVSVDTANQGMGDALAHAAFAPG